MQAHSGLFTALWKHINRSCKSIVASSGAIYYTLSSVAKSFAQLLSGFIVARCIVAEDLGLWSSLSIITTYAVFLQAGVINGLSRELPFYLGANKGEKAERLAGTALTYTLFCCLCVVLAGGLFFLVYRKWSFILLLSIVAVLFITLTSFYQNYLIVTFRSKDSFLNLAKAEFWTALVMVISVPLVYFWQYTGMVLRIMLITIVGVSLLHAVRPMRIGLVWSWEEFKALMKVGFPIFILSYIESAAGTTDKVTLLAVGGVEQVGYYSFALLVWGAFIVIPDSLMHYLYPRMTYSFGKDGNPLALWNSALKWTIIVIALMLPLSVGGCIMTPFIIPILFPNYTPAITATQILLFGALFYGAAIGVNALWSMKAWKYMITYQLTSALLRILGPLAGVKLFASPLIGVPCGMLTSYAINFGFGLGLTYIATHRGHSAIRNVDSTSDK